MHWKPDLVAIAEIQACYLARYFNYTYDQVEEMPKSKRVHLYELALASEKRDRAWQVQLMQAMMLGEWDSLSDYGQRTLDG